MKRGHGRRLSAASLLILGAAISIHAARHPKYLQARADLRTAQFYLDQEGQGAAPNVLQHVREAHAQCASAIHEIDAAAVIDRKDINDNPPHDPINYDAGRLKKVMELLASARRDLASEEDNSRALGWRDVAYRHIDEAVKMVRSAAQELRVDLPE